MGRKREIVEGQVYRKLGPGGGLWEVVSVRPDALGTRHAQLRRTDDPKSLKTFSVTTLLDTELFLPDAAP